MIKTAEVIEFFDRLAPGWDENLVKDEEKINRILYNARVFEGSTVLDVACGTGVMIPYYLKRNVASVTAVDISPEMARIAGSKFPQENVEVLCADVEKTDFGVPGSAMCGGQDAPWLREALSHPEKVEIHVQVI